MQQLKPSSQAFSIPLGFGIRINFAGIITLIFLGWMTYNGITHERWLGVSLLWLLFGILTGLPFWWLYRANHGKHSWAYPNITVDRLLQQLNTEYQTLGLTKDQTEMLRFWAERRNKNGWPQAQWERKVIYLHRDSHMPFESQILEGVEQRKQTIDELCTLGWLKPTRKHDTSPDRFLELDLRFAARKMQSVSA